MTIRNNDDLRLAYEILGIYAERNGQPDFANRWNDKVVELKRKIRAFNKEEKSRPRVAFSDEDSITYLQVFPESIQTFGEAEQFFYTYMERVVHSPYDCSGELFTAAHKVFQRRGRFYVYHTLEVDV